MDETPKQKLMNLSIETLADALLKLAAQDKPASDLVACLVSTPEENIKRVKAKLSGIKRMRRFVRWGESSVLAQKLEGLLDDLSSSVDDPRIGAELLAAFYETDNAVLGNCDDSSGYVGDIFRHTAQKLFVSYAVRCEDKDWLVKLLIKLNRTDDYGIRDSLLHCAALYLPKTHIRVLIASFEAESAKIHELVGKRHWLLLVESLARQIKDAPLFEKTRLASCGEPNIAANTEIAQVYLESGDAAMALRWLEQIPATATFMAQERDKILLAVHGQLGNTAKQHEAAWRIFRRGRSAKSLQSLLDVIGNEHRESAITNELSAIFQENALSLDDAHFMAEIGKITEAASYLLDRAGQLDGIHYNFILPLAKTLEEHGFALAATALYRALLNSILERANTKTYTHGVLYLKKLEDLSSLVTDWHSFDIHGSYANQLRLQHGRKSAFWSLNAQSKS